MDTRFRCYYTRLGIAPSCSPEEIRRAFRIAVKRLPPAGDSEEWREILEAYTVLRDPRARRRYDARRRGRAWGLEIAARLPKQRDAPSRLRLLLRLGFATSSWVIERLVARRDGREKTPAIRSPLAALPNGPCIAVALLDTFVAEVRQIMATNAPPETLAPGLSAILATYRREAARHLRNLDPATIRMHTPCNDGNLNALALMAIWGAGARPAKRKGRHRGGSGVQASETW